MPVSSVTSNDTLTLYGRVFNDLAEGDVSSITFPNDLVNMKTGKNKNTIYARDESGNNAMLILRVVRGSGDDTFLQTQLSLSEADFVSTALASGQFVKRLGDGQGNVTSDVYMLAGGVISKQVEGKENVSGDIEQAVSVYNFKFATATRSIQ